MSRLNYFTSHSITECFRRCGFEIEKIRHGYGDQYLWLEGHILPESAALEKSKALNIPAQIEELRNYAAQEEGRFETRLFISSEEAGNATADCTLGHVNQGSPLPSPHRPRVVAD